jgi:hypothetical protein
MSDMSRVQAELITDIVWDQLTKEGWTPREIGDAARAADARLTDQLEREELGR